MWCRSWCGVRAFPPQLALLDKCEDAKPEECKTKVVRKYCTSHVTDMIKGCRMSCGLCQRSRVPVPEETLDIKKGTVKVPRVGLSIEVGALRTPGKII
jgi:hypothetical protein